MENTLFSSTEAENWPSHTIPAKLQESEAARDTAKGVQGQGPFGMLAARAGAREVVLQRSAPDDSSYTGQPPARTEGDIRGFSASGRTRMRQQIQKLRRDANGLFLTLTWQTADVAGKEVKRCLHAFVQALRRRWDGIRWALIWRLEFQKRGTPHLHMLISGVRFEHKEWFKATWHRITGERSSSHRQMGAWVERWPPGSKLSSYVAKYMAKDGACPDGWHGRLWGVRRREALPVAPVDTVYRIPYNVAHRAALDLWERWGMDDGRPCPYSLRIWTEDPRGFIDQLLQQYDTEREAIPRGSAERVE